jgi:CheY-like chemotaxis protein
MDLQMPELNGFDATEYIRNTLNLKIPIIALTADVTTVDLAKCKAVGMNDYLAKPVDERLLYSKIVGFVKKAGTIPETPAAPILEAITSRCVDLSFLTHRTKSNPELMMEMISLYLVQTPPLVNTMKQSYEGKDWKKLYSAVHKIIPSFSIMGMSMDLENMAKKIQDYAGSQQIDGISDMVMQLEAACTQACKELEEEFNTIKSKQ